MDSQRSTYSYIPLNESNREIRLISLAPHKPYSADDSVGGSAIGKLRRRYNRLKSFGGSSSGLSVGSSAPRLSRTTADEPVNDDIRCTFSLVSLDETPKFEALSYAWGDPHAVAPIILDGHGFLVTANLHAALRHLRYADRELTLWVDALCINQADMEERTSQVAQMGDIFRSASTVVVFLWDEGIEKRKEMWDGCNLTLDLVEAMAENPSLHFDPALKPHIMVQGMSCISDYAHKSLVRFFSLPWFTRVWTVQEYVLARHIVLQFGMRELDITKLEAFLDNFEKHITECCIDNIAFWRRRVSYIGPTPYSTSIIEAYDRVYYLDTSRRFPLPYDMPELIHRFRRRKCHDPRDKIYGIIGMCSNQWIQADYNTPTSQVFIGFLNTWIENTRSLDILSYKCGSSTGAVELPSFVPDWTNSVHPEAIEVVSHRLEIVRKCYNTCKGTQADWKLSSLVKASSKSIFISSIAEIASTPKSKYKKDYSRWHKMAEISGHEMELENKSPYPSRDIVFREALLGGTIYDNDDAWRRFSNEDDYRAFISWDRQMKGRDEMVDTEAYPINCAFKAVSKGRYFVKTTGGHIGWAPRGAEIGDFVVVMPGGKVPYILRKTSKPESSGSTTTQQYTFIGDAYIQGIMDGEAYDEEKLEPIILV